MRSLTKAAVMTVHGIRTAGKWQKQIATSIASADMVPYAADFGYFPALAMCLPSARDRKVEWLRSVYNDVRRETQLPRPSVICHSFGTWLVGELLTRYDDVLFDKIVLAGSILPVNYDWVRLLGDERVFKVRNEVGTRDPWPGIAAHASSAFGAAGSQGFACQHPLLEEFVQDIGHSDTFHDGRFREWAEWLQRDPLPLASVQDIARVLAATLKQYVVLAGLEYAPRARVLVPYGHVLRVPDAALVWGKVAPYAEPDVALDSPSPAAVAYAENRAVLLGDAKVKPELVSWDHVAAPIRHPATGRVVAVLALTFDDGSPPQDKRVAMAAAFTADEIGQAFARSN
jgi:pimeloyl-ACP methyl ester carboxylesterase